MVADNKYNLPAEFVYKTFDEGLGYAMLDYWPVDLRKQFPQIDEEFNSLWKDATIAIAFIRKILDNADEYFEEMEE